MTILEIEIIFSFGDLFIGPANMQSDSDIPLDSEDLSVRPFFDMLTIIIYGSRKISGRMNR